MCRTGGQVLHVATEHGVMSIPLLARRLPPNLTIPDAIDVGDCFVNDRRTVVLPCKNEGGRGRFILVPDSEWPDPPEDIAGRSGALLPPFVVTPSQWELGPGESIDVTVDFAPEEHGLLERGFRLVCDNCSVHAYSVRGHALIPSLQLCSIDTLPTPKILADSVRGHALIPSLQLCSIDTLPIPRPLSDALRPSTALAFQPIAPGASSRKTLVLKNRTPLGMAYHWEVVHEDTPHTEKEEYLKRHGKVGVTHKVFSVSPAEGNIDPSGTLSLDITFSPT
ncbi:hypothetical protein T484DRAFT_1838182, partial [Baffinella frigidus]